MIVLNEPTISDAWLKLFRHCVTPGVDGVAPAVVTSDGVTRDIIKENLDVRAALDEALGNHGFSSVETVANTIFPQSLWNKQIPRERLYERYRVVWPRVHKCPANVRGTYFQRFIDFGLDPKRPIPEQKTVNQLDQIIDTWMNHGNHRHSALQLSVFDPKRDHLHTMRLGFPCLHQVAFTPVGPNGNGGLGVTGFYATQHLFEKAYGNYLGLCRLGQFVAHELGLELVRVTCVAALLKLAGCNKSKVAGLSAKLDSIEG